METPYTKVSGLWNAGMKISGLERGLKKYIMRLPIALPPYPEILEIGCGTAIASFTLIERFPNAHITATDIDPNMLLAAAKIAFKKKVPPERIEFGEADVNNPEEILYLSKEEWTHIKPDSFHCVIASAVMEHSDLEISLPVIARILKPGGYFINIGMSDSIIGKSYGTIFNFPVIAPEEFSRMLRINNFDEISVIPFLWNEFPTNLTRIGIIAKKRKLS